MTLHWIDISIIFMYFISILGIGIWNARKNRNDEESFLYASRKLTLPSFVMTLFVTWYGLILGVGEMIYYYGIMAWVVNGLLWYGVYLLYAFYFAPKIQNGNSGTIAKLFEKNYGSTSGNIAGIITAIMASPAAYILSLVTVIEFFIQSYEITEILGISSHLFLIILVSVFSGFYIFFQGFKAVIKTDILQFFLIFFGFISLAVFSVISYGGIDFITSNQNIPEISHLSFPGSMGWQMAIVWGFLALWTFVDPNFYQRCFSAKNKQIAKKGILISIGFWFIFDALTLFTGLYALGAFPSANPQMGYLFLADSVLPLGIKGIFFTAIVAIIMSTIDSMIFTSSSIFAKDFLKKYFKNISIKRLTQFGIIFTVFLSIFIVSTIESIILIIYSIGTLGVALLLPPMINIFFSKKRISEDQLLASLTFSSLILFFWFLYGWTHLDSYGFPVYPSISTVLNIQSENIWLKTPLEPMYPGLIFNSFFIWICTFSKSTFSKW